MPLHPRPKHTVDITKKPDGQYNVWLDGESIDPDTISGFEAKWNSNPEMPNMIEVIFTRKILVDKLSLAGVEIVEDGK